jgi:hypothetical protein
MKRFVAIAALLLLANPLLAAMGTYGYNTTTATGTPAAMVGYQVSGTDVKFLVKLTGDSLKTAGPPPATMCVMVAVGNDATAIDWKGADVGMFALTYASTTLTIGAIADHYCTSPTTASQTCTLSATTDSNDWSYVGTTDADKAVLDPATGTLTLEVKRPTAATTAAVDVAFVDGTSKIAVAYMAAACPTTGDIKPTIYTYFDTKKSSASFGSLTVLSWIAIALAALFLN